MRQRSALAILAISLIAVQVQCDHENQIECNIKPVSADGDTYGKGVSIQCYPPDMNFRMTMCGIIDGEDKCAPYPYPTDHWYRDRDLHPYSNYNLTVSRLDNNYSRVFNFTTDVGYPITGIKFKGETQRFETFLKIAWDIKDPSSLNGPPTGFRFKYCSNEECKTMDVHGHDTRDVEIPGLKPNTTYSITGRIFNINLGNTTLLSGIGWNVTTNATTLNSSSTPGPNDKTECHSKPLNVGTNYGEGLLVECFPKVEYSMKMCRYHDERDKCVSNTATDGRWEIGKGLKPFTEYTVTVVRKDNNYTREFYFRTDVGVPSTRIEFDRELAFEPFDDSVRIFWEMEDASSTNGPPTGFRFKYCASKEDCKEMDVPALNTRLVQIGGLKNSTNYTITGWVFNVNVDNKILINETLGTTINVTTAPFIETECDIKPVITDGSIFGEGISIRCTPNHTKFSMYFCGSYSYKDVCQYYNYSDGTLLIDRVLKPYSDYNVTVTRTDSTTNKTFYFKTDVGIPTTRLKFDNVSEPKSWETSVRLFWRIDEPNWVNGPPTGFHFKYCTGDDCNDMDVYGYGTRDIEITGLNPNTTYNVTGWMFNVNIENTTLKNRYWTNSINVTTLEKHVDPVSGSGVNKPLAISLSVIGACILVAVIGFVYWRNRQTITWYTRRTQRLEQVNFDEEEEPM